MNSNYYSVEQISEMLGIHPKTIQRYIREGKLRAAKFGKSWRVSGHDLSLFTESMENRADKNNSERSTEERLKISSVIDIEVYSRDEAVSIINHLNAALNVKPPEFGRSTMYTQYIEEERKVRLSLWGNAAFMSAIIDMVSTMLKQYEGM